MLELLDEGDSNPSAAQIARRAGVSKRTVFNHFPERQLLFEAAVLRRYESLLATLNEVPDDVTLEHRIDRFVIVRARTLELIAPLQRSMVRFKSESAGMSGRVSAADRALAADVGRVFAAELIGLPARSRRAITFALVAASSWTAWESYRVHQGLSAREARSALRAAITALLQPVGAKAEGFCRQTANC